jgi:mannose-6-phosphate isomerase-like protein (cupin superfamily)
MAGEEELLEIGPGTALRVISHGEDRLVVEASYAPGGAKPPAHLHPEQDEFFEALDGAMQTRIDGSAGEIRAGETLEIPAGTVHQMWNSGEQEAVLRWTTTPAGRTLDWFRELAAMLSGEPLSEPATLLDRYADVFRLAGG